MKRTIAAAGIVAALCTGALVGATTAYADPDDPLQCSSGSPDGSPASCSYSPVTGVYTPGNLYTPGNEPKRDIQPCEYFELCAPGS